jgi:hypothetical protein
MIGVDDAGLILGIFSVLISALEHCGKIAECGNDWWKFRTKYLKCKHDINRHRVEFEENLEKLLGLAIDDDEQLSNLLKEPGGAPWKHPDLERKLKERLPKSYEIYMNIVEEIKGVMETLKQKLGAGNISPQENVPYDEASTWCALFFIPLSDHC